MAFYLHQCNYSGAALQMGLEIIRMQKHLEYEFWEDQRRRNVW